jgi:hypothetical protein
LWRKPGTEIPGEYLPASMEVTVGTQEEVNTKTHPNIATMMIKTK